MRQFWKTMQKCDAVGGLAGVVILATVAVVGLNTLEPRDGRAESPNLDESAVAPYQLPEVLAGQDGRPAATADDWKTRCRPHQLRLVEQNIYGTRLPSVPVTVVGDVERADVMLAGDVPARRLQARLRLGEPADAPTVAVLLYLPKELPQGSKAAPVFLGLNFLGNQAEHPDPGIWLARSWLPDDKAAGIVEHEATDLSRGMHARRFPVEQMLIRGYGMATAYCGDIFPDRADGRPSSLPAATGQPAAGEGPSDEPGAIAAWAWGLSRILDWLQTLPEVDPGRVCVVGHSRLGKAAIWAGASDERFAMVVSNESGCGGAALSRRNFGETVGIITRKFPHWFCPAFASYAEREAEMPCDQHTVLALVAPRPLLVASAVEDLWADPRGEFLAAVAASPAWALFGKTGLGGASFPAPDNSIGGTLKYQLRSGRHDLIDDDWQRFADHADRELFGRSPPPADGYPAFHPLQTKLPAAMPPDAILLFGDGTEPARFTGMSGGPIDWRVEDGTLVVQTTAGHANHILSTEMFQDADIHAEFITAAEAHGNSGLYLHGHYEMQIYDSFGVEPPTEQDEGGLYRFGRPIVNASRPTGEWQVYDIRFIAPRRGPDGKITSPGRITAWLNGQLVQNGIRFTEPRSPYVPYRHGATDFLRGIEKQLLATGRGPLFLQDHGSPTRYRNVWIRPLGGK